MNFWTSGRKWWKQAILAVLDFQSLYSGCSANLEGEVRRRQREEYSSFDSTTVSKSFKIYI